MPDLSTLPFIAVTLTLGRYAVVAYATFATILTTACLTLHAITTLDRRTAARSFTTTPERHPSRPLFVRLEPVAEGD